MSTIATQPEQLWFLDSLVSFPVAQADGTDGISVMDGSARCGDSPPLHVHMTEDEAFHVIEGELRVQLGDDELTLRPGDTVLAPKGVPHTYRVESATARWLAMTTNGDFERFVRAMSRPAEFNMPPATAGPPTAEQQRRLVEVAGEHGIQFVGPPLA